VLQVKVAYVLLAFVSVALESEPTFMPEVPKTRSENSEPNGISAGSMGPHFMPTPIDEAPFSIVIRPQTSLAFSTLGHVLNTTSRISARHARMQGREVVWLPGWITLEIGTQTAVGKWLRNNDAACLPASRTRREEFLRGPNRARLRFIFAQPFLDCV